tara:strand:- start:10 stop:216 length:207 start_codon:yes stop_codon:yes gene_type:complete
MVNGNTNIEKFYKAVETIKSSAKCAVNGDVTNEEEFNKVLWEVGDSYTTTNPHSELTWTAVKAEMDKL